MLSGNQRAGLYFWSRAPACEYVDNCVKSSCISIVVNQISSLCLTNELECTERRVVQKICADMFIYFS